MSDLQAAIEIQVELGRFYNVDLFQRGYYQMRVALKTAPKAPVKVEVSLPHNSTCDLVFPASINNGVAISKTFQILYRSEDVTLNDVILFRAPMLVDSQKICECIEQADFQLSVELWFTDEEFGPDLQEKLQCVSQRTLKLHLTATRGLHHHVPLMFDYFHLSVVRMTIHGSLIALHRPYSCMPKQPKAAWTTSSEQSTMESVLFGTANKSQALATAYVLCQTSRLRQACHMHKVICKVLLCAYESLQTSLQDLMVVIPSLRSIKLDIVDCSKRLECLMQIAQSFVTEEDLLQTVQSDVSQLCGENVLLWTQYLQLVTLNDSINYELAKQHHTQRVKRFSEGFFSTEHPKKDALSCYEPSSHSHDDLAASVRNSAYFLSIPMLAVSCDEGDGTETTLPIIFEDAYCEQQVKPAVDSLAETSPHSTDSATPPGSTSSSRRRPKLRFVRSVATSRRQSGADVATLDSPDCQLVGYRKIHGAALGTFCHSTLNGTSSVPDLVSALAGGDNAGTGGSLPELWQASHKQPVSDCVSLASEQSSLSNCSTTAIESIHLDCHPLDRTLDEAATESGVLSNGDIDEKYWSGTCTLMELLKDEYDRSQAETDRVEEMLEQTDTSTVADDMCKTSEMSRRPSSPHLFKRIDSPTDIHDLDGVSKRPDTPDHIPKLDCLSRRPESPDDAAKSKRPDSPGNDSSSTGVVCEQPSVVAAWPEASTNTPTSDLSPAASDATTDSSSDKVPPAVTSPNSPPPRSTAPQWVGIGHARFRTPVSGGRGRRPMSAIVTSTSTPEFSSLGAYRLPQKLVSPVDEKLVRFATAKEELRSQLNFSCQWYSDRPTHASTDPYFWPCSDPKTCNDQGVHLIVCVHGLDGNSADLRLVRMYVEMALPGGRVDFLMSERNQADTFADFEVMTDKLVQEILQHLDVFSLSPTRISFVGHSLGNLIVRSALARPQMAPLLPKLYTFLSLSGPHLGTLYNSSGLINMGMWMIQKWKKSGSLLQLSLKDHPDPRQTFLYKLSEKPGLEFFRHVLVVGSQQDRYVPYHSSRIELCKAALRDNSPLGGVYAEMVCNILQPIVMNPDVNFLRYDVFHALPSSANTLIGRAAHIAVLDSEIFLEKFITVVALNYFK